MRLPKLEFINSDSHYANIGITLYGINLPTTNNNKSTIMNNEAYNSLRHLLAHFIEERSFLSAKMFFTCKQKVTEAIFNVYGNGHPSEGLPIVILVGDDYQLPPSFNSDETNDDVDDDYVLV